MKGSQQLVAYIADDLLSGRRRVGDHLPAERELADELGISRSSVREGLSVLNALGMLSVGVGSGPLAGTRLNPDPGAALGMLLKIQVASTHVPVQEVVDLRVLLETHAVTAVAATVKSFRSKGLDSSSVLNNRIDELLHAMDAPNISPLDFHKIDVEFHLALVGHTGTVLINALMNGLRDAVSSYVMEGLLRLHDWPSEAALLQREHRAIVASIRAGHVSHAANLVENHIRGFHKRTFG
jgi:GntR family transcriptional regulator, transcriptional repressor for pyruvate dehydrogenase complex